MKAYESLVTTVKSFMTIINLFMYTVMTQKLAIMPKQRRQQNATIVHIVDKSIY